MDERSELQQAWDDLQAVPSYFERDLSDGDPLGLPIVGFCGTCGFWHGEGEDCPLIVGVPLG